MSRNSGLRILRGTRGVAFAPVALLLAALTLTALAPGPSVAEDVASAAAKAQAAYFAGSSAELGKLAASTSAWSRSANAAEAYAHAYVQFRALQLAISGSRKKDATAAGEACITATDAATRRDPKLADAFALQSACYGYLANLGGFAAIGNGNPRELRAEH